MEKKDAEDGLLVRLKSGGPVMTVWGQKYPWGPSFEIPVKWIDALGQPHGGSFAPECLDVITEKNPGEKNPGEHDATYWEEKYERLLFHNEISDL